MGRGLINNRLRWSDGPWFDNRLKWSDRPWFDKQQSKMVGWAVV